MRSSDSVMTTTAKPQDDSQAETTSGGCMPPGLNTIAVCCGTLRHAHAEGRQVTDFKPKGDGALSHPCKGGRGIGDHL